MKKEIQWEFSIGFYEGLLFGLRAYEEEQSITYVLYVPLVDIALELPY